MSRFPRATRRGDTLIEVALALGIFSLVAIAVVSVVNVSTSSAQSALEITLVREEIDAQAEALRFIQNAYIAEGKANVSSSDKYQQLWKTITDLAKNGNNDSYNPQNSPTTCNYPTSVRYFVINPRKLGDSTPDNIALTNSTGNFQPADAYPRLVYGGTDNNALIDQSANSTNNRSITRIEGIYVVPKRDQNSTGVVSGDDFGNKSAFYDFHIRTCWFAPGADRPSTISTVIRLYDPASIVY